jgi:hypothetical protein
MAELSIGRSHFAGRFILFKEQTIGGGIMTMANVQTDTQAKAAQTGGFFGHLLSNEFMWIWLGTAILFVVSGFLAPGTVKLSSIAAMLPFAAMLAIAAVGQTVVIQQRGLDICNAFFCN